MHGVVTVYLDPNDAGDFNFEGLSKSVRNQIQCHTAIVEDETAAFTSRMRGN